MKDKLFIRFQELMGMVFQEHLDQIDKWGYQDHDINEWLNFTLEELGELAKAISEHRYRIGSRKEIVKEAIQVATLSLKIAEMNMIDEEKEKDKENNDWLKVSKKICNNNLKRYGINKEKQKSCDEINNPVCPSCPFITK